MLAMRIMPVMLLGGSALVASLLARTIEAKMICFPEGSALRLAQGEASPEAGGGPRPQARADAPCTDPSGCCCYNPSTPDPALMAHWPLNETSGTTATDVSGKNNTATLKSGAAFASQAVSLDGVAAYVEAGDVPNSDVGTALTVAYWVNPASLVPKQGHLGKAHPTAANTDNAWGVRTQNTAAGEVYVFVYAAVDGGSNLFLTSNLNLQATTWTHLAFVFSGTGATNADRLKVYKNGEAVNGSFEGTIPTSLNQNTAPVTLGRILIPGEAGLVNFQGLMDDVRIYNRVLTAEELKTLAKVRQRAILARTSP